MCHKANKAGVLGSLTFQGLGNVHLVIGFVKFIKIEYLCIFFSYTRPPNLYKLWVSQNPHLNIQDPSVYNLMTIPFQFPRKHDLSQTTKLLLDPSVCILLGMFKKIATPNKCHDLLRNKEFNPVQ